jgi:hypothetical protein
MSITPYTAKPEPLTGDDLDRYHKVADAINHESIIVDTKCPNCVSDIHRPLDVCSFAFAMGVIEERIERALTPEEIARVNALVSLEHLWDTFIGPAIDYIQETAEIGED